MNISIIIFRTFFYYILFLLLFKVMGKREIGELGVNDLLVSVLFAEFATLAISNYKEPLLVTLIPTLIIVFLQVIVSFLSLKSIKIRNLVDSSPALIMKNGNINFKEMEKQRYNLEDLLTQVRDKGIKSLDEVEYAILENNGKLSIFLKDISTSSLQSDLILASTLWQAFRKLSTLYVHVLALVNKTARGFIS